MSLKRKMVDTATGASPPWSSTREMASSPINFHSPMQVIASDDFHDCSTMNLGKCNVKEMNAMNEMNNRSLILPFPSPTTDRTNNNTIALSSTVSSKPVPLMSIEMNGNRVNSISDSSAAVNTINKTNDLNRYWPVDRVYQYDIQNHQQKLHQHRRYKSHHYQHRFYCRQCAKCADKKSYTTTSGDRHRDNNYPKRTHRACQTCHDCCF